MFFDVVNGFVGSTAIGCIIARAPRPGSHESVKSPGSEREVEVTAAECRYCPLPSQKLWNSHPRVFLTIEKTGGRCALLRHALRAKGRRMKDEGW